MLQTGKKHQMRKRDLFIAMTMCLVLFFGCEDFNSLFDPVKNILESKEGKAVNLVLKTQDEASVFKDELFSLGMDTLAVIDSLYNFLLGNKNVETVEVDSQGVAIDYKNGISGGVYFGVFPQVVVEGVPDASNLIDQIIDDSENKSIKVSKEINPTVKNTRTIYYDGAYSQFTLIGDDIMKAANEGFSKVGLNAFDVFLDEKATIDVLETLDQYGVIHLAGHGFYRKKTLGLQEGKRAYLLTGELVDLEKATGKYYNDILDKKIIFVNYQGKTFFAVSPKYVSDKNTFPEEEVFMYVGFCNGGRGFWKTEMVKNNGVSVVVGYSAAVIANWEAEWAIMMYNKMCDINLEKPISIIDCLSEIVNSNVGKYYSSTEGKYVFMKMQGDRYFTFWEPEMVFDKSILSYRLELQWDALCGGGSTGGTFVDGHGVGHDEIKAKLIKRGNSFFAHWNDPIWYDSTLTYYGSIEFSLENDENTYDERGFETNIANNIVFSLNMGPVGRSNRDFGWDVTILKAEYRIYNNKEIRFNIKGENTCDLVNIKYRSLGCIDEITYIKASTTGSNCDEDSFVAISMQNTK